jgi:hypothetical protein
MSALRRYCKYYRQSLNSQTDLQLLRRTESPLSVWVGHHPFPLLPHATALLVTLTLVP